MAIPNTTLTTSIPFVTGSYPNQVIPYTDYNLLIDNAYNQSAKFRSLNTINVSQSTVSTTGGGTFDLLYQINISTVNRNRPMMLAFHGQLRSNVTVANKLEFALVYNAGAGWVMVPSTALIARFSANSAVERVISIFQYIPTSVINTVRAAGSSLWLGWRTELISPPNPAITYIMPTGYKGISLDV